MASDVSILARPEGRAPRSAASTASRRMSVVSILARPEGRAPHAMSTACSTCTLQFQSSPDPKAGRHAAAPRGSHRRSSCFNPRPTRRPGATRWVTTSATASSTSFNPRPTRRPGATPSRPKSRHLKGFPPLPREPPATDPISTHLRSHPLPQDQRSLRLPAHADLPGFVDTAPGPRAIVRPPAAPRNRHPAVPRSTRRTAPSASPAGRTAGCPPARRSGPTTRV